VGRDEEPRPRAADLEPAQRRQDALHVDGEVIGVDVDEEALALVEVGGEGHVGAGGGVRCLAGHGGCWGCCLVFFCCDKFQLDNMLEFMGLSEGKSKGRGLFDQTCTLFDQRCVEAMFSAWTSGEAIDSCEITMD
jgi:hypothetical protein